MTRNGIRRSDAMTILALPQQRTAHARRPGTPERRTRPAGPTRVAASADLHAEPADVTVDELSATVTSPLARCAGSALDPDEWYPIASKPARARAEAARALAVCTVCPVRAECLELSMRVWEAAGQHGIWGGLVEADRAGARARWLAGTPVTALLKTIPAEHG
jgi:Transcription factor WhiB